MTASAAKDNTTDNTTRTAKKGNDLPADAGAATEEKAAERKPTTYVIFEQTDEAGDTFRKVKQMEAASSSQALRKHIGTDITEGTFVAVPKASFQPKTLKVETVQKVLLD